MEAVLTIFEQINSGAVAEADAVAALEVLGDIRLLNFVLWQVEEFIDRADSLAELVETIIYLPAQYFQKALRVWRSRREAWEKSRAPANEEQAPGLKTKGLAEEAQRGETGPEPGQKRKASEDLPTDQEEDLFALPTPCEFGAVCAIQVDQLPSGAKRRRVARALAPPGGSATARCSDEGPTADAKPKE